MKDVTYILDIIIYLFKPYTYDTAIHSKKAIINRGKFPLKLSNNTNT